MNPSTDDKGGIGSKIEDNNNNNNNNNSNNNNENDRLSKALARATSSSSATTTSRQWAGFKNPRIVRVSRTFGGKDRHSKVCTVRGLRDRRIRLSVPTAIQLYDLQDRLGLSQPSKVIDWLLDATKLDIDKLPPLQIPQGNFIDFHQQALFGHLANSSSSLVSEAHQFTPYLDANLTLMKEGPAIDNKEGININDDVDLDEDEDEEDQEDQSINPNLETMTKWNRKTSSDDQNGASASAQSFFPMPGSNGFVPGLMNGAGLMAPYGNMYHWDPSNLSLSQFGSHGSTSPVAPSHHQVEDPQLSNNNYSSTHQLFFCPPLATTSTLFPQHDNRFHHLSNSYGSVMRDFGPHGQMHPGANNAGQQQDKDDK